jgi:hypothetical protein
MDTIRILDHTTAEAIQHTVILTTIAITTPNQITTTLTDTIMVLGIQDTQTIGGLILTTTIVATTTIVITMVDTTILRTIIIPVIPTTLLVTTQTDTMFARNA